MRRLLPVLVLLMLCGVVPPARAEAGSSYSGRCGAMSDPDMPMLFGSSVESTLYAAVLVYAGTGPASAHVTCDVRVDGHSWGGASSSGTGAVVVAGRGPWLPVGYYSDVRLCTTVDFADATPTAEECVPVTSTEVPPPETYEPLYAAYDLIEEHVDPVVCAVLAGLAPGTPGVDVSPEGDVYVGGGLVWDCPPYGASEPPYGPRSTARGECRADTLSSQLATTGGNFSVDLTAAVVVYSPDAWSNPVTATVACRVLVDGYEAAATSGTGTGVVAHRDQVSFAASAEDTVELCTRVTFADGSPQTERCTAASTQVPPQEVIDAVADALRAPDAVACPAFVALAGTYGPVTVTGQGDVYVAGEPQWDCPPYDIWPSA